MKFVRTLVCLCLLWQLSAAESANSTLQLLQVLYRHGARTPIDLYPHDPNAVHFWSGLGQLTNEGKNNQYELGQFLRLRYSQFLHKRYHMNYTLVESSDVDRTLMSAQVNLAGLYPPTETQRWNPGLLWQPIPVHTRPADVDYKLRFIDSCARYRQAFAALATAPVMRRLDAEYAELYSYLSLHSGQQAISFEQAGSLYDTLWIEDSHGLPIPEWARARLPAYNRTVYPDLLHHINDVSSQLRSHTAELRRLGGGILLADMFAHMQQKVTATLQPAGRQLFMYSGHDFNVAALLSALGVYDGVTPPLASCVLVELHRRPTGAFFVQLFYRNDTSGPAHQLRLPNCKLQCPWEAFRDLTASVRPTDVTVECAKGPQGRAASTVVGEAAVIGLLLLMFLVAGVCYCRSRRRGRDFRYSPLDRE